MTRKPPKVIFYMILEAHKYTIVNYLRFLGMENRVKGAWIIHHSKKIQSIEKAATVYEQIDFAGKCGILLSSLSATEQMQMSRDRVNSLAKVVGISTRAELPSVLAELERQKCIDVSQNEIAVLGLTTSAVLDQTEKIFSESEPEVSEQAIIELSEEVSNLPLLAKDAKELISDTFKTPSRQTLSILTQGEQIGFFDHETLGQEKVYFNGNLFRGKNIKKITAVLSSLKPDEERKMAELFQRLDEAGCISHQDTDNIIGKSLLSKLTSIGLLDVNTVGNEKGRFSFITRPAAFSKFTDTIADDAFDLAKAFVTSLTYGMTTRSSSRGRITMIEALMRKLIQGHWVGPATAIGQDYKVLELKGVIEVSDQGNGRFKMRLLKKEVGQLALSVITEGEASTKSVLNQLPSISVSNYTGPEENRSFSRKRQAEPVKQSVAHLINNLRTGGIR